MLSAPTAVSRAEVGTPDPVKAVSVISTGTVEIHPEHAYGTGKPLYWWLLTSQEWLPQRPINAYVIEHGNGLLLFDTGQDRASVTDDTYFPSGMTGVIYDRLARFHIGEQGRSPPSSPASGTHRPTSTRRSCPTCTRTTWVGCPSCEPPTC